MFSVLLLVFLPLSLSRLKLVGRASESARLVLLASASPNAATGGDRGMGAAGESFHSSLSLFISVRCAASLSLLPRYVVGRLEVGRELRSPSNSQSMPPPPPLPRGERERETNDLLNQQRVRRHLSLSLRLRHHAGLRARHRAPTLAAACRRRRTGCRSLSPSLYFPTLLSSCCSRLSGERCLFHLASTHSSLPSSNLRCMSWAAMHSRSTDDAITITIRISFVPQI